MKTRLTPHYIDLVYDACHKSFWRRKSLAKFLRQCGVSESFLASWTDDESKRDLLDRLFAKLLKNDKGERALVLMAKYLIEQTSFPDLQNWEDSAEKIRAAQGAIARLKSYHQKQEEEIQSEADKQRIREEFRKRQEAVSRSQVSLQKLNEQLNELVGRIGEQQAGYDFQDWFYSLLDFSEIQNRRPYKHAGRQIDGSLTLSGTTYLVELKFTAEQAKPTDIDTFYRKVTSKADNTMGILVSISGYSSVAVKEASGERTPVLLLDHSHIYLVLSGIMGMGEVIDRVRRHASQTGEAYLPAPNFSG